MKYIFMSGVLILAGFLVALSYIPRGIEPLTEVYIENHEELPRNVYLNKTYGFYFTINNLEYQDVEYEYAIQALNEQGEVISEIGTGKVTLSHEQSETIYQEYSFKEPFDRAKIQVTVKKTFIGEPEFKKKLWWPGEQVEEIKVHFWVEEIVQTKIIITDD